ncbi:uncharacterized protein tex55 isoform X2 [Triplophysa dalaica]|uniref:uncharacterized protein tex55 isoform X2 n=1 Tax=Triplophysa dalaica TaxID=1582913 RepID=UPI0024DFF1DE|nr:uncharacterized protein tex55 isoform X2 [Triplophysa dalaica]
MAYTLLNSPNVNSECLCNSVKRKHAVFVMSLVLQPKVYEMADSGVLITESVRSSPEFTEPYARSVTYMERNNILQIFQDITENLIFNMPDDPLVFMLEQCVV